VSVSCIGRDTCLPGRFTKNNGIGPSAPRHLKSGGYKRIAQVAMPEGRSLLSGASLFHDFFKKECIAERAFVDSIHF
jgi:hypothetical protein